MLSFASAEQREEYIKNQLIANPLLINDLSFVLNYLTHIPYSIEQYPKDLVSNELFIYEYFSSKKAHPKEYSFIPEKLLDNAIFLNKAIINNPDIYLLVDPKFHTPLLFNRLEHYHPEEILKYANPEQLNNIVYCTSKIIKQSENYKFATDAVKKDTELLNTLASTYPFNNNLFQYFPKSILHDNKYMKKIIQHSIRSFQYLPKFLRNDPDFCYPVIIKDPMYFKYVSSELKNNSEWVYKILNHTNHTQFNQHLILVELPTSYFTVDFCKQHESIISNNFTDFTLEQRKIKALYMAGFKEVSRSYLKNHIAFLPNNELKKLVRGFVKTNKIMMINNYDEFLFQLINLMDKFDLHKTLEKDLIISTTVQQRLKL